MKKRGKNMNDEIQKYLNIIIEGLNHVEQPYYNLLTTYEPTGIVRERVFCYELYHQIRNVQISNQELYLTLNGEIDKRGHFEFEKKDRKNPDFVFHVPGNMERNTIVVEVKGNLESQYINECINDFETIVLFVQNYNYKMGIFILYNYTFNDFCKKLQIPLKEKFCNELAINGDDIKIICKKSEYANSEIHTLREVIKQNYICNSKK